MSTEFVQTGTGLVNLVEPKIKNYESIECVRKALAAGELHEGEHWTTYCTFTAPTDDLAALVYEMHSYIPAGTNPDDNTLVNQAMVSGLDLDDLPNIKACNDAQEAAIEEIKTCNTNQQTAIEARVTCTDYNAYTAANDACMACRVQCCDFNDFVTNIDSYISDRVCCSDYQTCCTAWDSAISTLQGKAGLDCVGTVTGVTVNGTACPATSGVVAITDVASASTLSTLSGTVSDLSTCPGLSCTGTLVPSDLNTINSDIADLKTCPGLSCTGTLTSADIASFITMADVNACGYTTCTGTVVASDIANFITMADVNACGYTTMSAVNACGFTTMSAVNACGFTTCTGTLTASDISDMATKTWVNNCGFSKATFSLSGNVLTITTA